MPGANICELYVDQAQNTSCPSPLRSSRRTTISCWTAAGRCSSSQRPVIKLPLEATEEDHLALLGLLNSSTACFWMKQVCHNKGSTVDRRRHRQRRALGARSSSSTGPSLARFLS